MRVAEGQDGRGICRETPTEGCQKRASCEAHAQTPAVHGGSHAKAHDTPSSRFESWAALSRLNKKGRIHSRVCKKTFGDAVATVGEGGGDREGNRQRELAQRPVMYPKQDCRGLPRFWKLIAGGRHRHAQAPDARVYPPGVRLTPLCAHRHEVRHRQTTEVFLPAPWNLRGQKCHRGRFRTARAQRGHSARTAPIITVIIRVTTLKTTHLRNHAQPVQISKIQTSDACHGSQGPEFCPL